MQLHALFLTIALLAVGGRAATIKWMDGADCTGKIIGTSENAATGSCISLTNSGSVRSVSYAGVQKNILFFQSGGGHDVCSNGAQETRSGSGCVNAPNGLNWQSVSLENP